MPRLFTAIEVPPHTREDLTRLQPAPTNGVTNTPAKQLHLTLCFIGDVTPPIADEVATSLGSVSVSSFTLELKGVGSFPCNDRPGYLWAGVQPSPALFNLRESIERAVQDHMRPQGRPYCPHVTLARLNSPCEDLMQSFLQTHREFQTQFQVDAFRLYETLGTLGDPHYTSVESFRLS